MALFNSTKYSFNQKTRVSNTTTLLVLQGTVGCIVDTGLLPVSRQLPEPFKWVVGCLSSFDKTSNTLTEHFRSTGLRNYPESVEEVVAILVFGTDYPNSVKM